MTDVMADLFVEVHPSKAKLSLFRNGSWFFIVSTVGAYSLRQMLLRVVTDGRTRTSFNALDDRGSWKFVIAFHGMRAETNPNMR